MRESIDWDKAFRILLFIMLVVSALSSIDLYQNYKSALVDVDGIACTSILHKLFGVFESGHWSVKRFYDAFAISLGVTLVLGIVNLIEIWYKITIVKRT